MKRNPARETPIEGVLRARREIFADERGGVLRMLRSDEPHFVDFGEVYFSTIYPGAVKAWKRHHSLTASYVCVSGLVRMVLYDDRPGSPSEGDVLELLMGPDHYDLLVVPPGIWNGFVGIADPASIVANCASEPYDPDEFDRLDPFDPAIPYRWTGKDTDDG